MRRMSAFSLMEMLIVLLIVAIIAAASAPMVSKKMSSVNIEGMDCLWKVLDDDENSISFNSLSKGEKSVIIGAKKTNLDSGSTEKPRLFIKTNSKSNPHLRLFFQDKLSSHIANLGISAGGDYWFNSSDFTTMPGNSVAIGASTTASKNSVAIGSGAHISSGTDAIAVGKNAGAYGDNAIAIGSVSAGKNEAKLGTDSHKVRLGKCEFENGVITADEIRVKKLVVEDALTADSTLVQIPTDLNVTGKLTANSGKFVAGIDVGSNLNVGMNLSVAWNSYLGTADQSATTYIRMNKNNGNVGDFYKVMRDFDSRHMNIHPDEVYTSDRRLKNVGEVFKGGLEEIKKLEIFNYVYKKDTTKTPHVGIMAQDLQKIFPNAVVKGDDGFLRIRTEDMFYALVNAVKELDKKFDLLAEKQKKIDELEKRIETLEKRLSRLEK